MLTHDKQSIQYVKQLINYNNGGQTYLYSSILDLTSYLGVKYSLRLIVTFEGLSKVRVVSCITLYADPPTLFGHSEYEGPPFFWVQVSVCENQQALILLQIDISLEVVKYLPSMKLFDTRIRSDSSLYNFLLL